MKRFVFVLCLLLALTPALYVANGSPDAQSSDAIVWSFAGGDISTINPVLASDQVSLYATGYLALQNLRRQNLHPVAVA